MTGLSRTGSGVSQESPPPWPSKRHVHVTSLTAVPRVLRHGVPIRGLQCVRARGLRSVRLVVGVCSDPGRLLRALSLLLAGHSFVVDAGL